MAAGEGDSGRRWDLSFIILFRYFVGCASIFKEVGKEMGGSAARPRARRRGGLNGTVKRAAHLSCFP